MSKYTLKKLDAYFKSKDFSISRVFCDNERVLFMTLKSENLFEEVLVSLDEKFKISKDSIDINVDCIDIKLSQTPFKDEEKEDKKLYDEMENSEMMDDEQRIKEGLALSNYKTIDINDNFEKEDETYKQYLSQLEKFKECVKNLKYKFGIITFNCVSYIQRNNSIIHYLIKDKTNYIPIENINFVISVDLENLIESMDTFCEDIIKLYKNFYKILSDAHKKQISALECQINSLTDIPVLLKSKNEKLIEMSSYMDKTSEMLALLYQQEVKTKKLFAENENFVPKNPKEEKLKEDKTGKLYREIETIKKKKEKAQLVLQNLKKMYNHDLISFDYNIFKSVHLFDNFAEKVKKIK
jgi:hypothetical protein